VFFSINKIFPIRRSLLSDTLLVQTHYILFLNLVQYTYTALKRGKIMGCNLELGLLPSPTSCTLSMGYNAESPKEEQVMTIFYNGSICVCDVTELQARSIITLASRKTPRIQRFSTGKADPISPALQFQQISHKTDLSLKRSLRQFLEKRKRRIHSTAPYYY
ncbi:Protein TIFY 5A, partial [Bienertia sinuspersici]